MPLFEVVILENPTKEEQDEGQCEKLILGPIPVIANDEQSAGIVAVMDAKESIKVDKLRMMVLVRPFV